MGPHRRINDMICCVRSHVHFHYINRLCCLASRRQSHQARLKPTRGVPRAIINNRDSPHTAFTSAEAATNPFYKKCRRKLVARKRLLRRSGSAQCDIRIVCRSVLHYVFALLMIILRQLTLAPMTRFACTRLQVHIRTKCSYIFKYICYNIIYQIETRLNMHSTSTERT